jgi:hypothetical protein
LVMEDFKNLLSYPIFPPTPVPNVSSFKSMALPTYLVSHSTWHIRDPNKC